MRANLLGLWAAALLLYAALPSAKCFAADTAAPDLGPESAAMARGDFKEARRLAIPLAGKGDAQAEHDLGLMYSMGWGVQQDFGQAAAWYEKAADQGLEAAENNLGTLYLHGSGVTKDYARALYWFQKAADQGAAQAEFNLGEMYENGLGVPQDYKEAAERYRKVAVGALNQWVQANTPRP